MLRAAKKPLTPKELFTLARFTADEVEDFYSQLKQAVDVEKSIHELRPTPTEILLTVASEVKVPRSRRAYET